MIQRREFKIETSTWLSRHVTDSNTFVEIKTFFSKRGKLRLPVAMMVNFFLPLLWSNFLFYNHKSDPSLAAVIQETAADTECELQSGHKQRQKWLLIQAANAKQFHSNL